MLPGSGCPEQVTLIPKLRVHFAEFLQHHSPKRLVFSTCPPVSVSGTVLMMELFPGTTSLHTQSDKHVQLTSSVTTIGFRNINLIPIDYGFRPRLRGRLTLRGLALRRNPWAYGESVSHTLYRYSCQHSHF